MLSQLSLNQNEKKIQINKSILKITNCALSGSIKSQKKVKFDLRMSYCCFLKEALQLKETTQSLRTLHLQQVGRDKLNNIDAKLNVSIKPGRPAKQLAKQLGCHLTL